MRLKKIKFSMIFFLIFTSCFFTTGSHLEIGGEESSGEESGGDSETNSDPLTPSENHTTLTLEQLSSNRYSGILLMKPLAPQGFHRSGQSELLDQTLFLYADVVDFNLGD